MVVGTGSPGDRGSAPRRRPAGPRSPTITIGFSPRYFRTCSWSLPPSLLTTARKRGASTGTRRWVGCGEPDGRGADAAVVAVAGVAGAGEEVVGAVCRALSDVF